MTRALGQDVGIDHGVNASVLLYLRLLPCLIDDAVELECVVSSFGRTAMEPGASLDAIAQSSHAWLRHRIAVVNALVHEAFTRVQPGDDRSRKPDVSARTLSGSTMDRYDVRC